ncbi:MAG: TatD family hydrolase [Candidatus Micrarchaeia archaeon]
MIIDTHFHIDSFESFSIPENIFPVLVGYSHKSNLKTAEMGEKLNLPYVLGIAPQTAIIEGIEKLDNWIDFIKSKNPVAIGEVGLDFYWAKTEKHLKDEYFLFDKMLDLSNTLNLPLVIHSRKSEKQVFEILKRREKRDFLMHYFSGDYLLAKEIIDFGGLISISPMHSKNRKEVIQKIPLEFLVVETDAPYVVRDIQDIKKAIQYISDVKSISFQDVEDETFKTSSKFFNLGERYGFF